MTITELGDGLINPIMRRGDLLFMQDDNGEYMLCEQGVGELLTFGYDDPSEAFYKELADLGFMRV